MPRKFVHFDEDPKQLIPHFERVKRSRYSQLTEARTYAQMYHNRPAVMAQGAVSTEVIDAQGIRDLGFNVLAEAAEGALSQIAKPLKCVVTPIGGTHRQRQSAEKLGQVISGVMEASGFQRIAAKLVLDSAFWPETHALWEIDPINKDARCPELDPHETFINSDRTEAVTRRRVSRRWAKAVFGTTPELEAAIEGLPKYKPEHLSGVDAMDMFDAEDCVALTMGWVLPVGRLPGRHVAQFSKDVVVVDRPWDMPVLPIVSMRWSEGHRGQSDGKPLGRAVAPFQTWETQLRFKMLDALAGAVPMVKAKEDPELSDVSYQFVKEDDNTGPVTIEIPKVLSAEVTETADGLREYAMRRAGVSEQAAAGTAPPQFKSGVALAQWVSIVNTRLSQQHQAHEDLWTQSGRILAYIGKDAYKNKPVNVKTAMGSDLIEQIDWPDLPEKSYSMSFKAVSALGDTISQKLENLQIAKEFGVITTERMWQHVNVPDFAAEVKRLNGPLDYIEYQIDRALTDAVVEPPIREMQDLKTLHQYATQAFLAMMAQRVRPPRQNQEALRILARLAKAGMGDAGVDVASQTAAVPTADPTAGANTQGADLASGVTVPTAPLFPAQGTPELPVPPSNLPLNV